MNTIQRITKNISVLFLAQMFSYIIGFFTLIYSARYLGVEGFGTLSFALAFTSIFNVFMDLGLTTLTTRDVSREKTLAKEYISNITLIKILLSIISLSCIYFIVKAMGYDPQTIRVLYLITFYTIFMAFTQFFYTIFQTHERMEYQSVANISISLLIFVGVLMAIYLKYNIEQFSLVYAISGAIVLLYTIILFSLKFFKPSVSWDIGKWKVLLREAWPFAITLISINIYLWIDTILLSIMKGPDAVGIYNAAYKLIIVLLFIPTVFNTALFPLMSKYFISSHESLKITFEKLFKIMILIAVPIGFGTMVIAPGAIMVIYGPEFVGSVLALQILIWSAVLIFARSPFERLLESSNQQISITKIFIIGLIFNIVLNILLIPHYSYVGAGIITVLTDILVLVLLIFVTRSLNFHITKKTQISLIKIIFSSIIMALVLILMQKVLPQLSLPLVIVIGIIIYLLLIFSLKTLDKSELVMIKSIFKGKEN